MNEFTEITKLQFIHHRLPAKDKAELLDSLKKVLDRDNKIMFAYIHGSFVERDSFRDLDVAIWINDRNKAFHYTVDFSAKIGLEIGISVDIQVLNEAPLPFKYNVFTRGVLLLSKDEALRLKVVDETTRQYMDLKMMAKFISMPPKV
jgi:hypothetical protein